MTASNLAVCFAPSLFHLTGSYGDSASSPRWINKQSAHVPSDQRDLQDQRAAHECLTDMIVHCRTLFIVSNIQFADMYCVAMSSNCRYIRNVCYVTGPGGDVQQVPSVVH
jgi:hypothetical protein